jgi:hypothetical protein
VHWIPRGKWECLRDCATEKGDPIPWVLRVDGKRVGGLELLLEWNLGFGLLIMEIGQLRGPYLLMDS